MEAAAKDVREGPGAVAEGAGTRFEALATLTTKAGRPAAPRTIREQGARIAAIYRVAIADAADGTDDAQHLTTAFDATMNASIEEVAGTIGVPAEAITPSEARIAALVAEARSAAAGPPPFPTVFKATKAQAAALDVVTARGRARAAKTTDLEAGTISYRTRDSLIAAGMLEAEGDRYRLTPRGINQTRAQVRQNEHVVWSKAFATEHDDRGIEVVRSAVRTAILSDDRPTEARPIPEEDAKPVSITGRRRSEAESLVQAEVFVIAALVAALAVVAPTTPTGNGVIDAVERAAFTFLMALAGSRARRWPLVVGATVVGALASGTSLLYGLVALAGVTALVVTDRRSRQVGAAMGGLIGVGAMHLDLGGFTGSSFLVAAVACGLILWSGYQVSGQAVRHRCRRAAAGVGIAIAACLVLSLAAALWARHPLGVAVTATQDAGSAARAGDSLAATAQLTIAQQNFERAHRRLSPPWLLPAQAVPVLGQNLRALRDLSGAGVDLAAAADQSISAIDYSKLSKRGGGIDLAELRALREPVLDTQASLRHADLVAARSASPVLVGPIAHRTSQFSEKITGLRRDADAAVDAVRHAPALLGADGPRRYLILLTNPAESRDLSGNVGNWVELVADHGDLELIQVGEPLDLAPTPGAKAINPSSYPPSYVNMRPVEFPQNLGASPDLPTVARLAATIFRDRTGRELDGVAMADPEAFAALLHLTGETTVPGVPGYALTERNAADFLLVGQYVQFQDEPTGNRAIESVVRRTFQTLTHLELPGPDSIGELFGPLVDEGRLQLASLHPGDRGYLDRVGLSGRVPVQPGHDQLGVMVRNANPSKIDSFLRRRTSAVVRWNPTTGSVHETITVTLRNTAPDHGLPPTLIGNQAGAATGTNVTDLAVVTPNRLLRVTVDGRRSPARPVWDGTSWRHEVRVAIPAGATRTIRFEVAGSLPAGPTYRLDAIGQPLAHDGRTTITVLPTLGHLTVPTHTVSGASDRSLELQLQY